MNDQTQTDSTVIQLELPNDSGVYYFEGGIKAGLEAMEQTLHFLENAGDMAGVAQMHSAQGSMSALLDIIRKAKVDMVTKRQQASKEDAAKAAPQRMPKVNRGANPLQPPQI